MPCPPCWPECSRNETNKSHKVSEGILDAQFNLERDLSGVRATEHLAQRHQRSAHLLAKLQAWMRQARAKLSRHSDVAKAMDYMPNRWASFVRFLSDGWVDPSNNAAERAPARHRHRPQGLAVRRVRPWW